MKNPMKTKTENPEGLHQRYKVTKADGSPIDPNSVYFVLRLDGGGKDPAHIKACREAAKAYFQSVFSNPDAKHLTKMANELRSLVNHLADVEKK
jgi:hypothetical protein